MTQLETYKSFTYSMFVFFDLYVRNCVNSVIKYIHENWKLFIIHVYKKTCLPRPIQLHSNYCAFVMASPDVPEEAMQTDRQQEASASRAQDTNVGHELTEEDLERTAMDYAQYLVVNCQQEVVSKSVEFFCCSSCVRSSDANGWLRNVQITCARLILVSACGVVTLGHSRHAKYET